MITRERTDLFDGSTSFERHHYIGSTPNASAQNIASIVRGHWGIEKGCHWVLEMAFDEDRARHRATNGAKSFTVLRLQALSLLKAETTEKVGVRNKRKCAACSETTSSSQSLGGSARARMRSPCSRLRIALTGEQRAW